MKIISFIFILFIVSSCKNETKRASELPSANTDTLSIKYAKGFEVINYAGFKVLKIKDPWPKAEKIYHYALVDETMLSKITLNRDEYDAIITIPIKKIVVTSTTHIPALELLHEEQTLVGFPGTDYVSSEKTRERIQSNHIRELGKNEGINTEVLLDVQPDVVVGFGIDGNNKTFETIKKSGIPVIYDGDWVESSPLAKAEWIKFFGVLYHKEKMADSIFQHIEKNYLDAKKLASGVITQPSVLSGAMHKDTWYLPSGTSSESQLLKDANTNYLWGDVSGEGSLALNFETVYDKGKNADIWISPSYYSSMEALEKANQHYSKFKAFQNKNVYSFTTSTGSTGGVLYFELGMARPDIVLKDLIKISHPELLQDYEPFFFKRLE